MKATRKALSEYMAAKNKAEKQVEACAEYVRKLRAVAAPFE